MPSASPRLLHPERLKFLGSPAPWVAIVTLVVAMVPHLIWLKDVDFAPLKYAGDVYELSSRAQISNLCSAISATIWRCSPPRCAGGHCAGMETAMVGGAGAAPVGAVHGAVVARREPGRE